MKFTRIRSKAQALHADSSTPSHKRDKVAGDRRRGVKFIPVQASDRPSPARSFPGVSGLEVIRDQKTGAWAVCANQGDLGRFLVMESAARARYYATVRRRGRVEKMARIDPNPLTDHTISFAPAQSDFIADMCARGVGQEVPRRVMARFIKMAMPLFSGRRYVLGAALHADTDDLHVDVIVARNGPDGRLGDAGLGLVGPWMVAVDRQIRSGAKINSTKRGQFERALANFRRREGSDSVPFDILLARTFDSAAERVLGPGLQAYIDRYAAAVPRLEREQLLADLREVEAVRDRLLTALDETSPELIRERALPRPAIRCADANDSNASSVADVVAPTAKALAYIPAFEPVI